MSWNHPCKLCVRSVPTWVVRTHVGFAIGAFGGAPCGATKRVKGVPRLMRVPRARLATGAFGGAP
eukprot:645992-Pyramimonas_sp.AAC.1